MSLFESLSLRINKIDDKLFKDDMVQFFLDPSAYYIWFDNWRSRYMALKDSYNIYKLEKTPYKIEFKEDFMTENRYIHYLFYNENRETDVRFKVSIAYLWFSFEDLKIVKENRTKQIENLFESNPGRKLNDIEFAYVRLFYKKIIEFLKENNFVVTNKDVNTKLIRADGRDIDIEKQILLDRKLLEKIKFNELL
jgi:hypothetical protein